MGYARVVVKLRSVAARLSMRPELLGRLNDGQVMQVLSSLGADLRECSAAEALATVAALVERSRQQDRHVASLETPAPRPLAPANSRPLVAPSRRLAASSSGSRRAPISRSP